MCLIGLNVISVFSLKVHPNAKQKSMSNLIRPAPPYTQITQTAWGLILWRGPHLAEGASLMRKCGALQLMRKCSAIKRATVSRLRVGQGQP